MTMPYACNKDGEKINPATFDTQIEIKGKLQQLLEGPGSDACSYTTQKLTLNGAGLAQGVAESCKLVRIHHGGTATYLSINQDNEDADANDWLVPKNIVVGPLPVVNAKHLHFYGSAADVVYLLLSK